MDANANGGRGPPIKAEDERSDLPEHALATGFADRVVRWAREGTAAESALQRLRSAAHAVSLATSAGEACTRLAAVAQGDGDVTGWREALLASGVVGTPDAPESRPLILDAEDRLYLHRYFDYERRLARQVALRRVAPPEFPAEKLRPRLDALFPRRHAGAGAPPDWQKIAAALALENRLTIVSGGPGTGKTTTIANFLALVLAENPDCRVKLAAPTGKAAARMMEAIRARAAHISPEIAERLPAESFTVHRLLGGTSDPNRFRHDAGNPLPADLLIVDEASMLDLSLATRLLEAVPPSARVVLIGDKDQLAAVDAGAVFAELCADPSLSPARIARLAGQTGIAAASIRTAPPSRSTGLADCVVWLVENFRFPASSRIGRFAALVNTGDARAAVLDLHARGDSALEWIDDAEFAPTSASTERIEAAIASYIAAFRADPADVAALFAAFAQLRVLCAERGGPRGVEAVNRILGRHFRRATDPPLEGGPQSEWYPGRPVMVLRNDYVQKLFNGDVGIALRDEAQALRVYFPAGDGGFRAVAPARLPQHESAFATTVHKAQGSEFDRVLLVLPARVNRVVTRELLYTAVTRAREAVTIFGGADVIEAAILTPTRRNSGLIARLAEIR